MPDNSSPADRTVRAVDLHDFEGADVWVDGDAHARLRGYFPLSPGTPNASEVAPEDLLIVSMEIEPGNHLPSHRDSAEELLVVTDGTVAVTVDEETVELSAGQCAVVPEMEPHVVENVGEETARVIGFFPDDELTATFEQPLLPFESNVVTIGDEQGRG